MANNNPPARADEKTNQEIYAKAAELLGLLFGITGKPGIFQQELPAGFKSRTEFVRSIMDAPGNKAFFDALPQPHTNTLATVMAARGNPLFLSELVVEFVARPNEGDDEYDDTESRIGRLRLLAEIAALTRDPATGNSRVALKLPFNGHLDFRGAVVGIFDALTPGEMLKLGLDKMESGGGFREFAADLDGVIGELVPRTLTPMQRFYLRAQQWAEQREVARTDREKRRGQHDRGGDAAAALPQAMPPAPKPEPAPTPAGPVIPNLATLTGGEPALAASPRASRPSKKAAATVPAVPAIAPPPAPPTEKLEPPADLATPSAADEDRELVIMALNAMTGPKEKILAAKAMAELLRKGIKTLTEAADYASRKGLL